VRDARLDLAAAARTDVGLLGRGGPARLHVEASAASRLDPGGGTRRTELGRLLAAGSVAPGHNLFYQYQLSAFEWAQAPQGLPYEPEM
jgi:hypothetical protein